MLMVGGRESYYVNEDEGFRTLRCVSGTETVDDMGQFRDGRREAIHFVHFYPNEILMAKF